MSRHDEAHWDERTLTTLGGAEEIRIGTLREGTLTHVPIWIVRVGENLYVRSFRGPGAHWFIRGVKQRHAVVTSGTTAVEVAVETIGDSRRDEIDQAYRVKYGRYGDAYIGPLTAPAAVGTTLQLLPR